MPASRKKTVTSGRPMQNGSDPQTCAAGVNGIDFPVIAIGASAGGLEACKKFLDAFPDASGMALILVQHLDPTHQSLMAELLGRRTSLTVLEATDGMPVERNHLYIIPPACLLVVADGVLRLEPTQAERGARLPFDFLLQSIALECHGNVVCVVLSGTGADGSVGLKAIKQNGGLVIAQDPTEAGYPGMPSSAIKTGAVDMVLPLAQIPDAIIRRLREGGPRDANGSGPPSTDRLPEIVELLRAQTTHDFTLYKPGTLKRRVERRMVMSGINVHDMSGYLVALNHDAGEVEHLAKDLLIHVTGFFRDPSVFEVLQKHIIPTLVGGRPTDDTIRIWVPGCSTGEEAYSLAMLFQEQIAVTSRSVKLQIFASDADPAVVAIAREGFYPETISSDVSAARLAAFFSKEDKGYRVQPGLRAAVVFTVQDLLADPPFFRIDLVSCRNVMIYLGIEAQRKVVALFHFALTKGGVLLLGKSESVGDVGDRFQVISKAAGLYRQIGRSAAGDVDFARTGSEAIRVPSQAAGVVPPSRRMTLAEFCQREVLRSHAPATVLSNHRHECLYSLGPTDRYLRMAPGHASLDVLAMVRGDLRTLLRSAILRAIQGNAPVIVTGGRAMHDGESLAFNIEVHPVQNDGEDLLVIYFVDQPHAAISQATISADSPALAERVAELERDLKTSQTELQGAIQSLEISSDEQMAINENAVSANEEFQSANEELLTSKEELQSLNEELTALNSQLQETLEQQRTASNDLQNVLYSTDVPTLFLDPQLNIRFFTPATSAVFHVIKTDVGRPLEDLRSFAADAALPDDARLVLATLTPIEREIETPHGVWCRRILPYRTNDNSVQGVVITFTDITQRRRTAEALEVAKQDAERANISKTRFLAAASHDLRQPLQTLALLQGLLASRIQGIDAERLVARLDDTIGSMSSMLNTLLDINQIEAGVVRAELTSFKLNGLFDRLHDAFAYQAQAQGTKLRVIPCALSVNSDPRLLKQILRNLVSNALKYTDSGKVLLGCRRHAGMLHVEVWDTGIGIPDSELKAIFEEYHQLDNAARERDRGLGLGLSIVRRLAALMDHRVHVRSWPGKGSVFSVEIPISSGDTAPLLQPTVLPSFDSGPEGTVSALPHQAGRVLIIDDDKDVRELLALILSDSGYHADAVVDGPAALAFAASVRPDLIITDYNLPNGMDGLAVTEKLREALGSELPVIVLTGDISTTALSAIAGQRCLKMNKPVKPIELNQAIQRLLPQKIAIDGSSPTELELPSATLAPQIIFVVDDDPNIRRMIRALLEGKGQIVADYASGEAFLEAYRPGSGGCLLIDAYLPGIGGLDLLLNLRAAGDLLPAIMITGSSDVAMAVATMRAGAADFIEKPVTAADLLTRLARALERSKDARKLVAWRESAAKHLHNLTPRQHQIMDLVLAGHPSKNIAADLGISQRTVENHRASIMRTTGTKSLPALARLALAGADAVEGTIAAEPRTPLPTHP